MQLIDPFEFHKMFSTVHSVAVIGNAPCILDWKNGATIDSYDMVVRFNRARTEGHEEYIGSRTDVLFVNASNSLKMAPSPAEIVQPRCLVCFVSPQGVKTLDLEPFRVWVKHCPVLLSFGPDLIGLPAPMRSRPLTSGTYALFTLLKLFDVQKLFVTGFTMFGAVPGGTGKYYKDDRPALGTFHDLDQEAGIFTALLGSFKGDLYVTEEIRALAREHGMQLGHSDSLHEGVATNRRSPLQRVAEGLSWRFIKAGMLLRRITESR